MKSYILEILCALFILLFTYTALMKYLSIDELSYVVGHAPLLKPLATPIAIAIPNLEMIIVILLLIKRTRVWGLYAFTAIMIMFTLFIEYMLKYANNLPCSCGGIIQQLNWKQHLFLNYSLIGLGVIAIIISIKIKKETLLKKANILTETNDGIGIILEKAQVY